LIGHGCTTGISAQDRAKTILALIDPKIRPEELGKPGHIFPLRAKKGGVLRRAGHTEAAIDLSKLAGFEAAGVIVEIMNEDGSMARLPELGEIAEKFDLKIISIADLIAYRMQNESLVHKSMECDFPTIWGEFKLAAFTQDNTEDEHLVLYKGEWSENDNVLVRVESASFTHNLLDALRSDKQSNLSAALRMIESEGAGAIVFVQQEEKKIGLTDKLKAYKGLKTPTAKGDKRDYGVGAHILRELGIQKLKLISNRSNMNSSVISAYGLTINEIVPFVEY
jgi:3,4-dihydroxy 2-butanone 4-phosphate synthase / GTP cyclohydrolase II